MARWKTGEADIEQLLDVRELQVVRGQAADGIPGLARARQTSPPRSRFSTPTRRTRSSWPTTPPASPAPRCSPTKGCAPPPAVGTSPSNVRSAPSSVRRSRRTAGCAGVATRSSTPPTPTRPSTPQKPSKPSTSPRPSSTPPNDSCPTSATSAPDTRRARRTAHEVLTESRLPHENGAQQTTTTTRSPRTTDHHLRSDHQRLQRKAHAENRKGGGSTPPLATEKGL